MRVKLLRSPVNRDCFVYKLIRPWNGRTCYIGKGSNKDRPSQHFWDARSEKHCNKHLQSIIKKAGGILPVVIIRDNLTESESFKVEIALIAAIGRADQKKGPLCNHTDGGEGTRGFRFKQTKEAVERSANARRGVKRTEEQIERIRIAVRNSSAAQPQPRDLVERRAAQFRGRKTWRRPDGTVYRDFNARNIDDVLGFYPKTQEMKDHMRIKNTGLRWWVTVSGEYYRAKEKRNDTDVIGKESPKQESNDKNSLSHIGLKHWM